MHFYARRVSRLSCHTTAIKKCNSSIQVLVACTLGAIQVHTKIHHFVRGCAAQLKISIHVLDIGKTVQPYRHKHQNKSQGKQTHYRCSPQL